MTQYKALVIPADLDKKLEEVVLDTRSGLYGMNSMHSHVFGTDLTEENQRRIFSVSSFRHRHAALAYDDEGLYNCPDDINYRAMLMYAWLAGVPLSQYMVPLVGTYLLFGLTVEGEDADLGGNVLMQAHRWAEVPRYTKEYIDARFPQGQARI